MGQIGLEGLHWKVENKYLKSCLTEICDLNICFQFFSAPLPNQSVSHKTFYLINLAKIKFFKQMTSKMTKMLPTYVQLSVWSYQLRHAAFPEIFLYSFGRDVFKASMPGWATEQTFTSEDSSQRFIVTISAWWVLIRTKPGRRM